jgi:anti-sigma factor RsiW
MMPGDSCISLFDLNAYLDGELDEGRRPVVERFLAEQPEMMARVSEYRRRDDALRKAFGELRTPKVVLIRHKPGLEAKVGRWRPWAVGIALCLALIASGWWLYSDSSALKHELARLLHDATAAHVLCQNHAGSRLGSAGSQKQFSPELTKLLGGAAKSPDLSAFGFHLVGVWKFPDEQRPAVLFAYRDSRGQLISCYFQLAHGRHETRFLRGEEAGFQVSYRLTPQLAYAVVGTLSVEQLQKIADAADTGIAENSEDDRNLTRQTKLMR